MTRKFKESKLAQKWLEFAERDFKTACLNHQHEGFTDTTCYFCHQTAEKALKTFLIFNKILDFPRTHILPSLLELCIRKDKGFENLQEHIEVLDRYYIETKYPSDVPVDYSKAEAEEAVRLASELLDFIRKKVM